MNKLLVVVDMQNDFLTGSLANSEAVKCIPVIKNAIKDFNCVIFTRDTHNESYLTTQEGKNLPVKHCIEGTDGHKVCLDLINEVLNIPVRFEFVNKSTFGADWIQEFGCTMPFDEVVFCGTCTDICVISCVATFKATYPEIPVKVLASGCAGTTKENHEATLKVLKSLQVEII